MPYIFLALSGVIPAAWTIFRRRDATLLATFFPAAALTDLADWIAYSCLDLYEYHPGLTRHPVLDETLGVVMAEFIFVGSLTVLLVRHQPRWLWGAFGALLVTAIQVVFTRTGLLVLHGWTPWLNLAGFLVFFWLMQSYYTGMQRYGLQAGWPRFIAQTGAVAMFSSLSALVVKVANAYVIHLNVLPTHARNQSLGRLIADILVSIPLGLWVLRSHWSSPAGRIAVATGVEILMNYGGVALHVFTFRAPWSPGAEGLLLGLALALAALTDAWIEGWAEDRPLVTV